MLCKYEYYVPQRETKQQAITSARIDGRIRNVPSVHAARPHIVGPPGRVTAAGYIAVPLRM